MLPLTARLENLEKRVAALERHVGPAWVLDQAASAKLPNKRGVKSEVSAYQLSSRRDLIFNFLGNNWPEVRILLRTAKSVEEFKQQIKSRYDDGRTWSQSAREFVSKIDALWEYSKDDRYSDDPEQVANAIAGHPEIKWRTSLNRCQRNPTTISLGIRSWRQHLKRKHPDLLKLLDAAQDEGQLKIALATSRSKDDAILGLKRHPANAKEWLESGKSQLNIGAP